MGKNKNYTYIIYNKVIKTEPKMAERVMKMNEVEVFNFEANEVRTVLINNEVWFVGKDIAKALGYKDTINALKSHVDIEDKKGWQITTPSRGSQNTNVINQSGVISLVLSSKLPSARKFKRWVTSEVIPSVMQHGAYLTDSKIEEVLTDPDTLIRLATQLKEERQEKKRLAEQVQIQAPKVQFAEQLEATQDSITIGTMAKLITQNGYKMGRNSLFTELRNSQLLISSGRDYNLPTQKAMNLGIFEVKTSTFGDKITHQTLVTVKGQQYLLSKIAKIVNEVA